MCSWQAEEPLPAQLQSSALFQGQEAHLPVWLAPLCWEHLPLFQLAQTATSLLVFIRSSAGKALPRCPAAGVSGSVQCTALEHHSAVPGLLLGSLSRGGAGYAQLPAPAVRGGCTAASLWISDACGMTCREKQSNSFNSFRTFSLLNLLIILPWEDSAVCISLLETAGSLPPEIWNHTGPT